MRPRVSATELVRGVVRNELKSQTQDRSLWKYRQIVEKDGKTQTSEIVETREGEVHRLLLVDGKLSVKERQSEDARIENLLANPDEFKNGRRNARRDAEQARTLLQSLAQAFLL